MGEGLHEEKPHFIPPTLEEEIIPRALTFFEASQRLDMLGKDESGMRYAFLRITANDMY